jgi:uncharacterized membrane protein
VSNLIKNELNSHISTGRIEALSDGVFAIAMTLLVLDLKLPVLVGNVTNQQLWQSLTQLGPNVLAFVLAFLLLGNTWAVHHRQFAVIERWDNRFVMINTIRLLVVVCIPFTTSLIANYGNLTIAELLFAANFLLISLTSYWQWDYAVKHNLLGNVSDQMKRLGRQKSLIASAISVLAMIAALIVPSYAAAVFMLNFVTGPILKSQDHE